VDKFATYSINSIVNGRTSPRIGILGQSTFPSEGDFANKSGIGFENSGGLFAGESKEGNFGFGSQMPGKIDDVSSSVNK
jgi:hypothetical protein